MNTHPNLAASTGAYPIETHARGHIGHIALGISTDAGIDILGG